MTNVGRFLEPEIFLSGFSSLVNPHHLFQSLKLYQAGDKAEIRAALGQEELLWDRQV